ncbi:MAG: GNAT family N-acetyltransferase [Bacteroidales bacterium]|nr:GNAT family N-acetyltransferase [Bacteroidales bacterium]MDD3664633.1 GNAT family N-acetyltransferase [Bacteroidales bacterium]
MLKINKINTVSDLGSYSIETIVEFLFTHLGRFGDSKEAIKASILYAFSDQEGKGGFLLTGQSGQELMSVVVVNSTGMSGFIPENILVYIAVRDDQRGKGIGAAMMKEALNRSEGNMALHVEYDNPARKLYERLGFKSKYAEMRFEKV